MTRSCAAMPRSSARRRTRRGVQGSRVGRAQRGPPAGRPRRAWSGRSRNQRRTTTNHTNYTNEKTADDADTRG
jgi:hypothetical protein